MYTYIQHTTLNTHTNVHTYKHVYIQFNTITLSVTRWSASVIKVGVAYMNVRVSRRLKEELAWVIDKWLWVISNKMLFKTVVPLRN